MRATVSSVKSAPAFMRPEPEDVAGADQLLGAGADRSLGYPVARSAPKPVPPSLRMLPGHQRRPSLKDPLPHSALAHATAEVGSDGATAGREEERGRGGAQSEFEMQKRRLACKMEIVHFYKGCGDALGTMTLAQNKELMKKLVCSSEVDKLAPAVGKFAEQREEQIRSWTMKADDQKGVQRRLNQLNAFCESALQ